MRILILYVIFKLAGKNFSYGRKSLQKSNKDKRTLSLSPGAIKPFSNQISYSYALVLASKLETVQGEIPSEADLNSCLQQERRVWLPDSMSEV